MDTRRVEFTTIATASELAALGDDTLVQYTEIGPFSLNGGHVDGTFVRSSFLSIESYWTLFNTAVFVDCRFESCVFRGASFMGCTFVECSFVNCQFLQDNLGGPCSFSENRWYGCTQASSDGLPAVVGPAAHVNSAGTPRDGGA